MFARVWRTAHEAKINFRIDQHFVGSPLYSFKSTKWGFE